MPLLKKGSAEGGYVVKYEILRRRKERLFYGSRVAKQVVAQGRWGSKVWQFLTAQRSQST